MISHFMKGILFVFVSLAPLYPFAPSNHSYAATYAYLSNSYDNTISVIHTLDNTVTKTVDVGEWPYGVAVSPDGEYIYVTNGGDNTVSVIRTSDNTVTASIPVGNSPGGIAVSPDCAYVYVSNNDDDTVSVIQTSNNKVIETVNVGL